MRKCALTGGGRRKKEEDEDGGCRRDFARYRHRGSWGEQSDGDGGGSGARETHGRALRREKANRLRSPGGRASSSTDEKLVGGSGASVLKGVGTVHRSSVTACSSLVSSGSSFSSFSQFFFSVFFIALRLPLSYVSTAERRRRGGRRRCRRRRRCSTVTRKLAINAGRAYSSSLFELNEPRRCEVTIYTPLALFARS